jgi:hypothetical protein
MPLLTAALLGLSACAGLSIEFSHPLPARRKIRKLADNTLREHGMVVPTGVEAVSSQGGNGRRWDKRTTVTLSSASTRR